MNRLTNLQLLHYPKQGRVVLFLHTSVVQHCLQQLQDVTVMLRTSKQMRISVTRCFELQLVQLECITSHVRTSTFCTGRPADGLRMHKLHTKFRENLPDNFKVRRIHNHVVISLSIPSDKLSELHLLVRLC